MTDFLKNIWYVMVDFVEFLFGVGLVTSSWILIIFFMVLIILLVLIFLFKKFKKRVLDTKQKLIYEYDNIFYLLASIQYKKEIDKESIGGDPCIAAIKSIINMDKPSYIPNKALIKKNIKKVETLLGEQVIADSIWRKINIFHAKLKSISLLYRILKVLFVLIILLSLGSLIYIISF